MWHTSAVLRIRPAEPSECDRLTAIAHAAKRHWGYPDEWISSWSDDLTYTASRFARETILVAELDEAIAGVVSISCHEREDGAELEGLWVDPALIGRGVGRALLGAALGEARAAGADHMIIVSDPHAVGFYERAGARQVGWVGSRPAGRSLPRLRLSL
jgi:predicted N-acetyltransferase YhbS